MPDTTAPSWARCVENLWLPAQWGGHPALDFCNTMAGWGGPTQHEYLTDFHHLWVFALDANLLGVAAAGPEPSRAAGAELRRARALRAAAYAVLTAAGNQDSWATISRAVEQAASAARFVPTSPMARWVLPAELGVRLPVLALARSLGELLGSQDVAYISRCPGDGCGWIFLDRTRRRRWCSMAVCGNRAKARRHADKAAAHQQGD